MPSSLRGSDSTLSKEPSQSKRHPLAMARSISSSLRNRFKQVFGKTTYTLPPQQMDASRPHFGDAFGDEHGNGGFDDYHSSDVTSQRRQSLYNSPWNEDIDHEAVHRLSTIIPVNASSGSLAPSSKSRVTSWTNTTESGSMRETLMERKRLSVIQEHGGPHQPSNSAGTHLGGVPMHRKPLPSRAGNGLEAQRLYSALVRRMDQESADRVKDPLHGLQEEAEENDKTIESTREDLSLATQSLLGDTSVDLDKGFAGRVPSCLNSEVLQEAQGRSTLKNVGSEESVYSRTTNGGLDSKYELGMRTGPHSLYAEDSSTYGTNFQMRHGGGINNPYCESDIWGSGPIDDDQLGQNRAVDNSQQHTSATIPSLAATGTYQEPTDSRLGSAMSSNDNDEANNLKPLSNRDYNKTHFREDAQIQAESSLSRLNRGIAKATMEDSNPAGGLDGDTRSIHRRTPSPTPKMPTQLSIAKRRFPLLNVRQVNKQETPLPSRNSSLTRSQSGLLQEIAHSKQGQTQSHNEPEKHGKLSASFRKFSAENVANLLKGKRSVPYLGSQVAGKENRPATTEFGIPAGDNGEAASTPGPAYVAMRSGNSSTKQADKNKTVKDESPTNLVKAALSARLSRPFDMDTPGVNRPFDSMYLGKREQGFHDISGGRLSVAVKGHPYGYAKQRSFDRGPGGYGGLGPSPFESPDKSEGETALPHIPTPENKHSRNDARSGLSLGSKRLVSNFLRSRRRANDSESEGPSISHEEHMKRKANNDSPLFV